MLFSATANFSQTQPGPLRGSDIVPGDVPEGFIAGWPRMLVVLTPQSVPLSEIVLDQCVRAGLDPTHVDVHELEDDLVDGYVISKQDSVKSCIAPLCQAFYFDGVESASDCDELGSWGPCEPAVVFHDSFSGIDGSNLINHHPEIAPEGWNWAGSYRDVEVVGNNGIIQSGKLTVRTNSEGISSYNTVAADLGLQYPFTMELAVTLTGIDDLFTLSAELRAAVSAGPSVLIEFYYAGGLPVFGVFVNPDGETPASDANIPITIGSHTIVVLLEQTQTTISVDGVARSPFTSTLGSTSVIPFTGVRLVIAEDGSDRVSIDDLKITQLCPASEETP